MYKCLRDPTTDISSWIFYLIEMFTDVTPAMLMNEIYLMPDWAAENIDMIIYDAIIAYKLPSPICDLPCFILSNA